MEDSSEYSGKITQALVFIKGELGGDVDATSMKSSSSRRKQRSASKESIASDCSQHSHYSDIEEKSSRKIAAVGNKEIFRKDTGVSRILGQLCERDS